jgi:hypothetical protein
LTAFARSNHQSGAHPTDVVTRWEQGAVEVGWRLESLIGPDLRLHGGGFSGYVQAPALLEALLAKRQY